MIPILQSLCVKLLRYPIRDIKGGKHQRVMTDGGTPKLMVNEREACVGSRRASRSSSIDETLVCPAIPVPVVEGFVDSVPAGAVIVSPFASGATPRSTSRKDTRNVRNWGSFSR